VALNIGPGVVFALGIVFTAFMLTVSWGGASWVFGSAVSIVVGGLALARERHRAPAAVAGLATMGMAAALVTGPVLRGLDLDRRSDVAPPRGSRAGLPRS
jgi:hypothetical protein